MKRYKEKFIWQNLFYSNLTIIIIVFLIVLLGKGILGLYKKYKITKMDYVYVSKEVEEAKRKMEMNELKLEDISTKEGEEKYIRETYPMKREGENVIVVYNAPASTYEIPKKESNWGSFQEFLRKIFKK